MPITLCPSDARYAAWRPGAAGGVESDADRKSVEDLAYQRLLDVEELISRLVVERSPSCVAFARRDRRRLDAVAELVGGVEQLADLAESGDGEVPVVSARKRTEESDSFEAEEIGQRVLVDHGRVDEGNSRRSCERAATRSWFLRCPRPLAVQLLSAGAGDDIFR